MRYAALLGGALAIALGGLWLLQGLDLVRMRPILCFADCQPVEHGSPLWAVVGAAALCGGMLAVAFGLRRRP
jgi:hypothetical protein